MDKTAGQIREIAKEFQGKLFIAPLKLAKLEVAKNWEAPVIDVPQDRISSIQSKSRVHRRIHGPAVYYFPMDDFVIWHVNLDEEIRREFMRKAPWGWSDSLLLSLMVGTLVFLTKLFGN